MHEPKASSYQWNKLALRTRYCAKEKKKKKNTVKEQDSFLAIFVQIGTARACRR